MIFIMISDGKYPLSYARDKGNNKIVKFIEGTSNPLKRFNIHREDYIKGYEFIR